MPKHRVHTIEFKRQVCQEFAGGETLYGLAKRHGICRNGHQARGRQDRRGADGGRRVTVSIDQQQPENRKPSDFRLGSGRAAQATLSGSSFARRSRNSRRRIPSGHNLPGSAAEHSQPNLRPRRAAPRARRRPKPHDVRLGAALGVPFSSISGKSLGDVEMDKPSIGTGAPARRCP